MNEKLEKAAQSAAQLFEDLLAVNAAAENTAMQIVIEDALGTAAELRNRLLRLAIH